MTEVTIFGCLNYGLIETFLFPEGKPPLFIRRNQIKIPVAEYFSKPKSLPRPKLREHYLTKASVSKGVYNKDTIPLPKEHFTL